MNMDIIYIFLSSYLFKTTSTYFTLVSSFINFQPSINQLLNSQNDYSLLYSFISNIILNFPSPMQQFLKGFDPNRSMCIAYKIIELLYSKEISDFKRINIMICFCFGWLTYCSCLTNYQEICQNGQL